MTADQIIARLGLTPHPEGGHYRQTWIAQGPGRTAGTAIYFLLKAGERSHWHRVDAAEIWHFYAGDPLELHISPDAVGVTTHVLGPDLLAGQRPQILVGSHAWQAAESAGNQTVLEAVTDEFIQIHNDTCAEFYLRVTATAAPAGAISDAGTD